MQTLISNLSWNIMKVDKSKKIEASLFLRSSLKSPNNICNKKNIKLFRKGNEIISKNGSKLSQ